MVTDGDHGGEQSGKLEMIVEQDEKSKLLW